MVRRLPSYPHAHRRKILQQNRAIRPNRRNALTGKEYDMLTSQDIAILRNALDIATNANTTITPAVADALDAKLVAMIPPPATPIPRCTRCGRQQGDSQNLDCDMAPCHFV